MADYIKVWLICLRCGYNIEVSENEVMGYGECVICGGKMVLDMNKGKKIEEPLGDNFPKLDRNTIYKIGNDNPQEKQKPITQEEIEDFRVDLNILSPKEIFRKLGG